MRFQRYYRAGADELYEAFVDVARLRQWFRPQVGLAAFRAESHDAPAGASLGFRTPYGEITLRFSWRDRIAGKALAFDLLRTDARGSQESRGTVKFETQGDKARLILQHDGVPAEDAVEVEAAWRHGLNRLICACPRALDAFYARQRAPSGFRSKFGGLWPDRPDAEARLAHKRAAGELDDADAARFEHWMQKGYVQLEQAVPPELCDVLRAEIARDWERGNDRVLIELCDPEGGFHPLQPALRERPHKVLDYHAVSETAREIQFAPAIQRFLGQLFERPPLVTQSLLFRYGTEQAMHQDTAYVVMRSPMEFVGGWVALEDVAEGSGELQYYEGSHRIPEFVWFDRARARPPGFDDDAEFLAWVKEQSEQRGCELARFKPKKGDALIWHADLVHGGSPRVERDLTRWSLVSHYTPLDVGPWWMDDDHERLRHRDDCYYTRLPEWAT